MENKAQGAIEYLLIIGAAILVVAIVIIAITSVMNAGQEQNTTGLTAQQTQQMELGCQASCDYTIEIGTDTVECTDAPGYGGC